MAARFINLDRDTPMLLPPDLRDWVEADELVRELKLLTLGSVSLDGTHIKASASKDQNVTYARAGQLCGQLQLDVKELLEQAETSDREDHDPQKLP